MQFLTTHTLIIIIMHAVSICTQPADPGRGIAATPRYFFNSSSGQCDKFVYGGCGGNGNNFMTSEACNQQCNPNGKVNHSS